MKINKTIIQVVESTATGTLAMVQLISNSLAKRGFEIHIIYSLRSDSPKEIESLFDENIHLHYLNMTGLSGIFCLFKLRKLILSLNPDVVHLHSSKAGFLGRCSLLNTSLNNIYYSPHCISFLRKDISYLKKMLFIFLERMANRKKCTYLACSRSEMLEIKKYLKCNVILIENSFDLPVYDSAELNQFVNGKIRVISVGGLRAQKDPIFFAKISDFFDKELFEFIWVGDGDEIIKKELSLKNIRVTGWLDKQGVIDILRSSNIYISTSLWEGMPISVIEAMAYNIPVVARKSVGNVDVIKDRQTGFLFLTESEAVEAINFIVNQKEIREKIIKQAQGEVNDRFSNHRFISDLLYIYFKN